MNKFAGFLALVTLSFADFALASAVVTSAAGTVQATIGTSSPRPVRVGDQLNQGDTVVTGASSSVVMKFDDGQVAALSSNSRMTITTYAYSKEAQKGTSLLSLASGGMRFLTGLIGKNSRENVSIRAATATIGIRGTELTCVTESGVVYCQVEDGEISLTFNGKTVVLGVGTAALTQANGTIAQGTIQQMLSQLQATPAGAAIAAQLGGLQGLTNAIRQANPGVPVQGQGPAEGGTSFGTNQGTPGASGGTGGGGGGTPPPASPS